MNLRFCFATLLLLLFFSACFSQSPAWVRTYHPGTLDLDGHFMAGNEITQIVVHKGKLFAGNSDWEESDTINNPPACEVVRLDSAAGQWQVDTTFSYRCYCDLPDTAFDINVNAMNSFVFSSDYTGSSIIPDTLLIAAPGNYLRKLIVYVRNDATNSWATSVIGGTLDKPFSCRSLGFHQDTINGICYVFAGVENYGVVKGVYNTSYPGKIQWDSIPEVVPPTGERVMGFTVCNNILYAASSHAGGGAGHIYARTDRAGSWTLVETLANGGGEDLRGLTAIPNPEGPGEVLWYCWNSVAHRLDPFNAYADTMEYAFADSLTAQLGISVKAVLAAYNDNIPEFNVQHNSGDVRVIGFELRYDSAALLSSPRPNYFGYATDGRYFVRRQNGSAISYQLDYIVNNSPVIKDTLLSVRTLCVSPFACDSGEVLYGGGYDCNTLPADRKAWIYRGDFRTGVPNGLEEIRSRSAMRVFPNPASGQFTVELQNRDFAQMVYLYDVTGRVVYEEELFSTGYSPFYSASTEGLSGGVYFVRVVLQDSSSVVGEVVVVKR